MCLQGRLRVLTRRINAAVVIIVSLATGSALLAADGPEWRRARGRLTVLTAPTQVARLVAPLPGDGDELGRSVAVAPA